MKPLLLFLATAAVALAVFFAVPPAEGLGNLVRIIYFHVPTAWLSVLAFVTSAWYAARYLRGNRPRYDRLSARAAKLGFVFVLLSTVSGAVFSKLTWGAYWNWDPRQTTIFVLILIYGAYLTLRATIADRRTRARTAAVYSLFSCLAVPFLVFILPRMYFSLHPSPILNPDGQMQMDATMLGVLVAALVDGTAIYFWLLFRHDSHGEDEP